MNRKRLGGVKGEGPLGHVLRSDIEEKLCMHVEKSNEQI